MVEKVKPAATFSSLARGHDEVGGDRPSTGQIALAGDRVTRSLGATHTIPAVRSAPILERATQLLGRGGGAGWRAPLACGAVGEFNPSRAEALAALMPGATERALEGNARLWLDREPIRWSGKASLGLAWSESFAETKVIPRNRRQTARDAAASGIEIEGERVTLHGSGLGLQPLYVHREGTATYFCTRLAPLADAAPSALAVDWAAWSAIFEFGCPFGVRTGFEGIERLEPGAWISHAGPGSPGVLGSDGWSWAEIENEVRS